MADIPNPPKPNPRPETAEGLAEVERALSVLQGRHPEHERARREDEAKLAKRKAELDAAERAETRRIWKRRLMIGGPITVAVVAIVAVSLLAKDEMDRRGRLEQASDPHRAMGFVVLETSGRNEPSKVEASAPAGCLVATTTTPTQLKMVFAGAAGTVEGPSPLVTCICEGARVTVTADTKTGDGIALLRADASVVGGSRAFPFLPFKAGTMGRTDPLCTEASLDAWIDAKRWAQPGAVEPAAATAPAAVTVTAAASGSVDSAASDRWLSADEARGRLRTSGFKLAGRVVRAAPFGVVEVPAETCVLILPESASDKWSVRLKGGVNAVGPAAGNLAWCTMAEAVVLVQRDVDPAASAPMAGGDLAVLFGPAGRVGGLMGLREIAGHAGLPLAAASVSPADHAWNAKHMLVSSAIPATLISTATAPDFGTDPEARIVAVSVAKAGSVVPETPADVFSFCDPPLETANGTVCVFSGPQRWRVEGAEAVGGLARSKLPFWLFALQNVNEPVALKIAAQVITLARGLDHEGFEATTIEAVTELDKGAEVLGRANEDAMVVFALSPNEPWFFPYTDGPKWSLDGAPRIVPIKALERITVTPVNPTRPLPPKATRRTVVFRRHTR